MAGAILFEQAQAIFSLGDIVHCTTCFNQTLEGEMMAFDPKTKMIILKCPADSGSKKFNDVYIVNLELCSDVQVKTEVSTIPNPPQSLNLQRLSTRVRNTVEQKKRLVSALAAGATPEGQKLYLVISKTITQISWQGPVIVVFGDTFIAPPYKVENVTGADERRVKYIRKIVENHLKDTSSCAGANSGSSSASSSSGNSIDTNVVPNHPTQSSTPAAASTTTPNPSTASAN